MMRFFGAMDVILPTHPGPFLGGNGPHSPPGGAQNQGAGHPYVCEALFSAPYLIWLLLELGAPRPGFCVLFGYITCQGDAYTTRTGLPFPKPITTRDQFDATWKSLTAPLASSRPVECADPPLSARCWPLRSWAQYMRSRPPFCQSIYLPRPLTFVVRVD